MCWYSNGVKSMWDEWEGLTGRGEGEREVRWLKEGDMRLEKCTGEGL